MMAMHMTQNLLQQFTPALATELCLSCINRQNGWDLTADINPTQNLFILSNDVFGKLIRRSSGSFSMHQKQMVHNRNRHPVTV